MRYRTVYAGFDFAHGTNIPSLDGYVYYWQDYSHSDQTPIWIYAPTATVAVRNLGREGHDISSASMSGLAEGFARLFEDPQPDEVVIKTFADSDGGETRFLYSLTRLTPRPATDEERNAILLLLAATDIADRIVHRRLTS